MEEAVRRFLRRKLFRSLRRLFQLQDSLVEHKFPGVVPPYHFNADWILSYPGDIYRAMTHVYPDYGYLGPKWEYTTAYAAAPPRGKLNGNDWEEIKIMVKDPAYRHARDQYLENLHRLKQETIKTSMGPKRRDVMIASLDMIEAFIHWFESLDPYNPPKVALEKLTDVISNYFPREFWAE